MMLDETLPNDTAPNPEDEVDYIAFGHRGVAMQRVWAWGRRQLLASGHGRTKRGPRL
jgi:hypothetical protein